MARKQLNADVRAFLKGDQSSEPEKQASTPEKPEEVATASEPAPTEKISGGGLLADILGADQQSEAVVRYTADLPESLHQRLSYAAVASKTTKIKLLRQILDKILPELPT
jgi:hypothetical protein